MSFLSSSARYIEVPLKELIELSDNLGKIRLATDINEKGKVYSVKDTDISSSSVQQKFLEKGIESVNIEITPKVIEYIVEKHPERYSDKNLDPNVMLAQTDELLPNTYIRENVYDERDKIIVPKWTLLKQDTINLIKNFGVKSEYEIYEPLDIIETTLVKDKTQKNIKPHILIVDDQAYVTESLKMALEDNDLNISVCNKTDNIISFIRQIMPDIILLDINMPVMNGFQILEALGKFGALKKIPVIMLTARNMKEDIMAAIQLGAVDYIVKPFNYKIILNKIAKFLPQEKKYWIETHFAADSKNSGVSETQPEELKNKINDILDKI